MKLVVAGSRGINNAEHCIKEFCLHNSVDEIVHGGCENSPDMSASKIAKELGIKETVFLADWELYGKSAGPIRNKTMAVYSDTLLVFSNNTNGAENMVKEARKEGLVIYRAIKDRFGNYLSLGSTIVLPDGSEQVVSTIDGYIINGFDHTLLSVK